jgi:hypothetical protein
MSETIRVTRPEPPPRVGAEIEIAHTPIPKWMIGEFFGTFLLGGGIYRVFFRTAYRS